MRRIEHVNDPGVLPANSLIPAASAIVVDKDGRILLIRRSDNALWSIPGGAMEVGERIDDTVVREVREETGLQVVPEAIVGIYSNPLHVIEYADGEVRQQFSICFACRRVGGEVEADEPEGWGQAGLIARSSVGSYRASPNEVTRPSMVDPLRHKDLACGVAVTPFSEAL
jgi:ADP-ribose pyrophosphatase YjhB (NUDIX family)